LLKKSPYVLLLIATCLWGGNFVVGKAMVTQLPPITLAALRWLVAFVMVVLMFGRSYRTHREVLLQHWKMVIFLAVTGVAGFNTLTYIAVQHISSINASLMNAATPIMILMISWFMLRDKVVWMSVTGIVVSMAGVLWIISRGSWQAILTLSFNPGDLWMVLAVFCWALYSVGMKKISGVLPVNALFLAKIAVTLCLLIPASAVELSITKPAVQWSFGLAAGVLYVGIFASIVAFAAWNQAIAMIGPSRCGGFLNMIPLFSACFATVFAGERIQSYHLIGAVLIIGGVYLTNRILRSPHKQMQPR
jgi:drug/metabolite transporter (DMT)-like permease